MVMTLLYKALSKVFAHFYA
ncbi:hypothetical protein ADUPG1_004687, partial [Aduncisulcus paluster]